MKKYVLPQMKKLFAAVDKKYAKMTCETCHGKKAADNKFKMPSAELPVAARADRSRWASWRSPQKKPDVVKFMGTQVKPTMAALIGQARVDGEDARRASAATAATPWMKAARPLRRPPAPPIRRRRSPAAAAPAAPAKGGWLVAQARSRARGGEGRRAGATAARAAAAAARDMAS